MKFLIAAAACSALLAFAVPAVADPTDNGIGFNPGLQVNCAFNPAFRNKHQSACHDITVDSVASNGGPPAPPTSNPPPPPPGP